MSGQAFELRPLPDTVADAAKPNCEVCFGDGWVCEAHPLRPFDTHLDCGVGQPCVCTGLEPPPSPPAESPQ